MGSYKSPHSRKGTSSRHIGTEQRSLWKGMRVLGHGTWPLAFPVSGGVSCSATPVAGARWREARPAAAPTETPPLSAGLSFLFAISHLFALSFTSFSCRGAALLPSFVHRPPLHITLPTPLIPRCTGFTTVGFWGAEGPTYFTGDAVVALA